MIILTVLNGRAFLVKWILLLMQIGKRTDATLGG